MNPLTLKSKYLAFVLDKSSREKLLKAFPPLFDDVICHHVTLMFNNVDEDTVEQYIDVKKAKVVGYVSDKSLECLVVEINGSSKRNDGGTFHITLSLVKGKRKPVDSNALLKKPQFNNYVAVPNIEISGSVKLEIK